MIYWPDLRVVPVVAGNQSPIPFDILYGLEGDGRLGWESITNPL